MHDINLVKKLFTLSFRREILLENVYFRNVCIQNKFIKIIATVIEINNTVLFLVVCPSPVRIQSRYLYTRV